MKPIFKLLKYIVGVFSLNIAWYTFAWHILEVESKAVGVIAVCITFAYWGLSDQNFRKKESNNEKENM